jgi:beta-galactosidase
MFPMPGFAADLCGATVEDYTFVRPEEEPPKIAWGLDAVPAPVFHDILAAGEGTQVLACFSGGYYDGKPALTKKCWPGGGVAYYLGSGFSREMAELLLRETGAAEPYASELTCTPQVEVAVRVKDAVRYCFLLNYSGSAQRFVLHTPWRDAVEGAELTGEQVLEPYGVRVLIKP